TTPTALHTLSLHDALPISSHGFRTCGREPLGIRDGETYYDEEHMVYVLPQDASAAGTVSPADRQYSVWRRSGYAASDDPDLLDRSEEHTSELQSRENLVCR